MPTIRETHNQMIQFVFPEYTDTQGNIQGGRLMDWIMLIGSITSSRIAKGPTVLGATDSIDFLNPVSVGEIVILDSWVEYVSNTSLEVTVRVHSENLETGEKKFITLSYLAFVAIDEFALPRKIPEIIEGSNERENFIINKAKERKEIRLPLIQRTQESIQNVVDETEVTRFNLETSRIVMPEDAFSGKFMSVGKLLKYIDESALILAKKFVKGVLVTGSLDDLYFYSPIKVGEVLNLKAGITYVGETSLECAIKVESEDLEKGTSAFTCTAFISFVHIDPNGKPIPVPKFEPETPYELRLWNGAEDRKLERLSRVSITKELTEHYIENYQNAIMKYEEEMTQ